jgi:hypothetical protein
MHFAFIAYGARTEVELLIRDMEAQKFLLRMTKEGEKDKGIYLGGQIRILPFGVMEYVFPKEYRDLVLNTMCNNTAPNRYNVPKIFRAIFRKALKLKPIPQYKEGERLIWKTEHVSIMPLGIREDSELIEPKDM